VNFLASKVEAFGGPLASVLGRTIFPSGDLHEQRFVGIALVNCVVFVLDAFAISQQKDLMMTVV